MENKPKMNEGVAELEEGDCLELEARPPVNVKTDNSYATVFKNLEELGKGKFGVVYKVKRKPDGGIFAAKFVRKSASSKKEVLREIEMMNLLHHKRLIQLYDAYETTQDMIVIMELVTGGELFEKVVEDDNLTERQVIRYMKQVIYGVQHMHRKNMVHLDLKPENILCLGGGKPGYEEIKLIDFGMTRVLDKDGDERVMGGTPEFIAPEVLKYDPVTVAADMWSLGVITYVLLSGLSPFMGDDDNETMENVSSGEYDFEDEDEIFENLSDEVKLFIQDLLILDPTQRLTVAECLEHSWLRNEGSERKIDTSNLKKFIARRRWQRTMNTIKAVSRLAGGLSLFGNKGTGAHGAGRGNFLSAVRIQEAKEREAEEAEKKKKEEEERKAAEKKRKEEEAAEKKRQVEAEKKRKEQEAAEKKRKEEEEEKKRKEVEAAEKKRKEEEERKAAAEKKRLEEEAAEKKRKEVEAAEKKQNEAEAAEKKRKEAEATEKKQKEAEAAEKKRQEEAEKKRKEQEAAEKKRKDEEAAEKKRKETEAAEKKWKEEAERKQREEEEKKRKEHEVAEKKKKEEAEVAEKKRKEAEEAQKKQKEEEERKVVEEAKAKENEEKKQSQAASKDSADGGEKKLKRMDSIRNKLKRKDSTKKKDVDKLEKKKREEEEKKKKEQEKAEKKRKEEEEKAEKKRQKEEEKKMKKLSEEERKKLRDDARKKMQEERKSDQESNNNEEQVTVAINGEVEAKTDKKTPRKIVLKPGKMIQINGYTGLSKKSPSPKPKKKTDEGTSGQSVATNDKK
ncbi:death-associated protein kinase 3-like isoform X3 [Clytia hemisphaerica]|uniref:death-associated protein kinase 3-like isoform X3 n=1 Tax=Clytia hemisphaerica TaxID=252671 RepID=UPI0034D46094